MENFYQERALLYTFLSRAYLREADEELLKLVASFDFTSFGEDGPIDKGFTLLEKFVTTRGTPTLMDLARDYARCFFGAGLAKDAGAYPYESVYTSRDHLLMQEARDEVVDCYSTDNLGRASGYKEPEDHIAFELEYMARLCTKAEEAILAGDRETEQEYFSRQQAFFYDHLNRWADRFCDDLMDIAKEDFYRGVALITKGFILEEREVLLRGKENPLNV